VIWVIISRLTNDVQALEVGEDAQAQVLQRALADPAHEEGLRPRSAPVEEGAGDEGHDDEVQRAEVVGADALVDGQGRQRRGCQRRRGGGHEGEQHEQHPAAVGAQEHEDAAQLAPAAARLAQAATELGDVDRRTSLAKSGGRNLPLHSPATLRSLGLRVRKTRSGRPRFTISR
jgi:hypothetical protein